MADNLAESQSAAVLNNFALNQLARVRRRDIRESSFLEFAACAFFTGAEQLLRKQSQLEAEQSRLVLVGLLKEICAVDEFNARGLVESVERLREKYYLIESLMEQGSIAAEQWLNCGEVNDKALQEMLNKYRHTTLFELGIEGINEQHESKQNALYLQIDYTVQEMRRRTLKRLLLTGT